MTALNERSRALLKVARDDALAPRDKARLRAELAAKLALGLPTEAPTGAPTPRSPAPTAGPVAPALVTGKTIAAGTLIGVIAFIGGFLTGKTQLDAPAVLPAASASPTSAPVAAPSALAPKEEPRPPSAPTEATRAAVIARPIASAAPKAPSLTPRRAADPIVDEVPAAAAPATSASGSNGLSESVAPPSAQSTLAAEMALLRESQNAVLGGDSARALARLDDLALRYPDGQLREERMAARVLALCAAGRTEEARAEAERLFRAVPGSLHAERIRASCAFGKKRD